MRSLCSRNAEHCYYSSHMMQSCPDNAALPRLRCATCDAAKPLVSKLAPCCQHVKLCVMPYLPRISRTAALTSSFCGHKYHTQTTVA